MNLSVYSSFHRSFPFNPASLFVFPVAVNAAMARVLPCSELSGENISYVNPHYCEVTTQYWVAKNRPSQFVGFLHYRRYLNFLAAGSAAAPFSETEANAEIIERLSNEEQKRACLDLLGEYEMITPYYTAFSISIAQQYCLCHGPDSTDNWKLFLRAIEDVLPQYKDLLGWFDSASKGPMCNMYITRWEVFVKCFSELFPVMNYIFKSMYASRSVDKIGRQPAYLAERFFAFWVWANQIKTVEVPSVFLKDPS